MGTPNEILFLILGWLLGLVSPQLTDVVKRHYQKKHVTAALLVEMNETRVRLALIVYIIAHHFSEVDKPLIAWVRKALEGYHGGYPTERISQTLEKMSKLTDEGLVALQGATREPENVSLSIKPFRLPLLDSGTEFLQFFDTGFQTLAYEARSQLAVLNEEVENSVYYHRLTFNAGISAKNQELAIENLLEAFRNVERQAKLLVEKIDSLLERL